VSGNVSDGVPEGATPIQDRLAELRNLLAEKYPSTPQNPGGILPSGISSIDSVEGGLRRAAITEFTGSTGSGALLRHALFYTLVRERCFGALVDAARSFEADSLPGQALSRMLWVGCQNAVQAVKATDLLLRDGNLSLVMLDLQLMPGTQLRRIAVHTWHRFLRLAEQTSAAVVVLTPSPMVESAQVRIVARERWTLQAQRQWREELVSSMALQVFPRRTRVLPAETPIRVFA
jgi:hypothetical protein